MLKPHLVLLPVLALVLACTDQTIERINLDDYGQKVFSQHGEDGVIDQIFKIIKPTTKYAVEFGAHDGVNNSNTRNLTLNHGWGGFLIEGNPYRAKLLAETYAENPKVTTQHSWVFPGNIEILFEEAGVPKNLDFLVIDIDSNDYYVWRAIYSYRPKVVMIEYNLSFPPPELAVIDFHPFNYWDATNYHGASLQSMYDLAQEKGYELIHVMNAGPNTFFVDKQYYDLFGIEDNSPVKMARPPARVLGNEKEYPEAKKTLKIESFEIEKKWIER